MVRNDLEAMQHRVLVRKWIHWRHYWCLLEQLWSTSQLSP